MARFNTLLGAVSASLTQLVAAAQGLALMSSELEEAEAALVRGAVPAAWQRAAYPSLKPLGSWLKDLEQRVAFVRRWLRRGAPRCFVLPALFFPQGLLTGLLQRHARRHAVAVDSLAFSYTVRAEAEAADVTDDSAVPDDGALMSGFLLDGARWDAQRGHLAESLPKRNLEPLPVVHFLPTEASADDAAPAEAPTAATAPAPAAPPQQRAWTYECPLYKTADRAGTLSTTGASTNFIVAVSLPAGDHPPDHWVRMGTALLCASAD